MALRLRSSGGRIRLVDSLTSLALEDATGLFDFALNCLWCELPALTLTFSNLGLLRWSPEFSRLDLSVLRLPDLDWAQAVFLRRASSLV